MVVREPLNFWSKHGVTFPVPTQGLMKLEQTSQATSESRDGCEDIEQVFDIRVLRHYPSPLFKAKLTFNPSWETDQSNGIWLHGGGEMMGANIVTKAPVQDVKERTQIVENVLSVGNGGERLAEVFLVGALRGERDSFEKVTSIRAEFAECRRGE